MSMHPTNNDLPPIGIISPFSKKLVYSYIGTLIIWFKRNKHITNKSKYLILLTLRPTNHMTITTNEQMSGVYA